MLLVNHGWMPFGGLLEGLFSVTLAMSRDGEVLASGDPLGVLGLGALSVLVKEKEQTDL